MSGIRPPSLIVIVAVILTGSLCRAADSGPDPRIKQLNVLDQLAGSWTGTQPGSRRKVQTTSEWILDGRVLQTTSQLTDGRELLILRTYDPALRKYIVSVWDSRGMAVILPGTWDEQQRTLTATTKAGETTISVVSQMTDDDTEQWQIQFTDSRGKPQRKFGGTNRRNGN